MMRLLTRVQNSRRVCQSRPLRAKREASMANTAPAVPVQIAVNKRSKPGRAAPRRAASRAAQVIVDDDHIFPPKSPCADCKAVLTTAALGLVDELAGSGLSHIHIGATRQVLRRDLAHRPPPSPLRGRRCIR